MVSLHGLGVAALLVALAAACGAPQATHPGELTSSCAGFGRGTPDASSPDADTAATEPYVQNVVTDDHGAPLHRDVIGERADGTLSLRRVGSSTDLPVVGGGACGVTVFEDGKAWVVLAPVPADSADSVVLSSGNDVGEASNAARLPSGQLVNAAVTTVALPRHPMTFWETTSGGYSAGDGERGRSIDVAGAHVVVYPRSHLVSTRADRLDLSRVGALPAVTGVAPNSEEDTYLALLPAGARKVSMQLDPPEGAGTTGQGPVSIVHLPGTSYDIAAVEHVPPESTRLAIRWVDARGTVRHWTT